MKDDSEGRPAAFTTKGRLVGWSVGCDHALRAVSAAADGELDGTARERLTAHLATCDDCSGFERSVTALRAQLRVEPVDASPDVVGRVLEAVRTSAPAPTPTPIRRTPFVPPPGARRSGIRLVPTVGALLARAPAGAAAAIGFLAGASYVGLGTSDPPPAAADLPQRIVTLQDAVSSLAADIEVTEYGRPDRTGPRQFAGHLAYGGPEELQLDLQETANSRDRALASGTPGDGDVELSVTGDRWTLEAVRGCTATPGRAACPDGATRTVREVTGRTPFSEAAPIPLELVTPVDSFTLASAPTSLGERSLAGRSAIGVTLPASQAASFIDQLSPAGDLRAVYPTDPVEMWLDRDSLVPLELVVTAAPGPERQRWAAAEGYDDRPSEPILEFTASSVEINSTPAGVTTADTDPIDLDERERARAFDAESDLSYSDEGFDAGEAPSVPTPATLPTEFAVSRSGTVSTRGGPTVEVRSWTDGRAWLKIEATQEWESDHLFGGLGAAVRRVGLDGAGHGYLSADGRKVALHTDDLDLMLTGSLPTNDLVALAGSLGLDGERAPRGWREADATTLAGAADAVPGLLTPSSLDGFSRPAVRVAGGATVTQVYAGPGDRGFVLTQSTTPELAPPTEDALGVEVRGVAGRYSVDQALLEWTEGGSSFSLASPTLALTELLDIATALSTR